MDFFKKLFLIIEIRDTQRPPLSLNGLAFPQYFKPLGITANLPMYLMTFFHLFFTPGRSADSQISKKRLYFPDNGNLPSSALLWTS